MVDCKRKKKKERKNEKGVNYNESRRKVEETGEFSRKCKIPTPVQLDRIIPADL